MQTAISSDLRWGVSVQLGHGAFRPSETRHETADATALLTRATLGEV